MKLALTHMQTHTVHRVKLLPSVVVPSDSRAAFSQNSLLKNVKKPRYPALASLRSAGCIVAGAATHACRNPQSLDEFSRQPKHLATSAI